MKRHLTSHLLEWLPAGFVLTALVTVSGCTCGFPIGQHNHLNKCADIEKGSLPQPHGSFVRAFQSVQTGKADADHFVIYLNEWYMGGTDLGPFGQNHLKNIAHRLPDVPFQVVLENSWDEGLDQIRRRRVVETLAAAGIADADVRVAVRCSDALDLDANEAPRIYRQMLIPQTSPNSNNNGLNRTGILPGLLGGGSPLGGAGFFGGSGNYFGN